MTELRSIMLTIAMTIIFKEFLIMQGTADVTGKVASLYPFYRLEY